MEIGTNEEPDHRSPYELLTKRQPNLSGLVTFGCLTHGLIVKNLRDTKLGDIAFTGFNLGLARYQRGWIIWIPGRNQFRLARTAKFNERVINKDIAGGGPDPLVSLVVDDDSGSGDSDAGDDDGASTQGGSTTSTPRSETQGPGGSPASTAPSPPSVRAGNTKTGGVPSIHGTHAPVGIRRRAASGAIERTRGDMPHAGLRHAGFPHRGAWRQGTHVGTPVDEPPAATNLANGRRERCPQVLGSPQAVSLLTNIADGDVEEESYLLEGNAAQLLAPARSYYPTGKGPPGVPVATRQRKAAPRHTRRKPQRPGKKSR